MDNEWLTKDELLDLIRSLQSERLAKELSDDFAYSNGSIDRIDKEIAEARAQLYALSQQ